MTELGRRRDATSQTVVHHGAWPPDITTRLYVTRPRTPTNAVHRGAIESDGLTQTSVEPVGTAENTSSNVQHSTQHLCGLRRSREKSVAVVDATVTYACMSVAAGSTSTERPTRRNWRDQNARHSDDGNVSFETRRNGRSKQTNMVAGDDSIRSQLHGKMGRPPPRLYKPRFDSARPTAAQSCQS